jgi:glutathione S-transferase
MPELHLVLGNKNYSSWSMRPWVVLRHFGIPFTEETIWLDTPTAREQKLRHSPTGRVPILRHGEVTIWDSLAICEYVAELFPAKNLWPRDAATRALARALVAEMHAGFTALRSELPVNCKRTRPLGRPMSDACKEDVRRITDIFAGAKGPFLLGDYSIADAFYTPVASRLRSYGVTLTGTAASYAASLLGTDAAKAWHELAAAETHVLAPYDAIP